MPVQPSTVHRMSSKEMTAMPKRKSHLKLGKETYGNMTKEEAFKKALAPYFTKEGR